MAKNLFLSYILLTCISLFAFDTNHKPFSTPLAVISNEQNQHETKENTDDNLEQISYIEKLGKYLENKFSIYVKRRGRKYNRV